MGLFMRAALRGVEATNFANHVRIQTGKALTFPVAQSKLDFKGVRSFGQIRTMKGTALSLPEEYEAYALRYASTNANKAGKFHDFAAFCEPDEPAPMEFYFWLLRNEDRIVLVDCGFDNVRTALRGYLHTHHPIELLARFGVRAEDVDHVVISHMHFDHIGNVDLFPNATFSLSSKEFEFWTGPYADRMHLGRHADSVEVQMVAKLHREGRVHLVNGPEELFPGIRVTPLRGHTPGQMITEVTTASGTVVLASDAIHYYEELERDRPYWVFTDLEGMYKSYSFLNELALDPGVSVVAGHDPAVLSRFKAVDADCVDLAVRAELVGPHHGHRTKEEHIPS
jgi:glyoxylase-like metal-dependent hydrolase (beta-lactamase superfamily II)